MKRIRSDIVVGLGLVILLLSVIPALAADEAIPGSVCGPMVSSSNGADPSNRVDPADVERGETNNDYGSLSLHARAGMTGTETGDIKSGESRVNCDPGLENRPSYERAPEVISPPDEG